MIRAFFSVSFWTALSRVFGFFREILLASVLGAGPITDAFNAAFRVPNSFRRVFAEGGYSAAFIPLASAARSKGGQSGFVDFHRLSLGWLLAVLTPFSILMVIFMPQVMLVIVPGFREEPGKFELAVTLGRICFGYLGAMSLLAHFSGALNCLNRFATAAAAPALLNIFMIAALLFWVPQSAYKGQILAWAVLLSGIAQVALVVMATRRAGIRVSPRFPKPRSDMLRLVWLMLPALIGAGAYQINLIVSTNLVSAIPGAVSYLAFADRISLLPVALVGVAFGVVLLPQLSAAIRSGSEEAANTQLNKAIVNVLALALPAAVALALLSLELAEGLYQRGAFTAKDSQATASVIRLYALGLPAFVLIKIMLPGYFARENTKSPMLMSLVSIAANVVFAVLLIPRMGFAAVALAGSIAGWINLILLAVGLVRRSFWTPDRELIIGLVKFGVIIPLYFAFLFISVILLDRLFAFPTLLELIILIFLSGLIYLPAIHFLGLLDLRLIFRKN